MSRVRKIKVDGVIVSHSEQGAYISVTTSGTLYDAKCLTSIGVNALFKELERVSDWRERLQGELAELSNTNRTLASTAASLQSKLNASQDEVSEFIKESVKHDEYARGLCTTNSTLNRHIVALDAKIAEQTELITDLNVLTQENIELCTLKVRMQEKERELFRITERCESLTRRHEEHKTVINMLCKDLGIADKEFVHPKLVSELELKHKQTELIDTLEKLAFSEQEHAATQKELSDVTLTRDQLGAMYNEMLALRNALSKENTELRSDNSLNIAEAKIAEMQTYCDNQAIEIKNLRQFEFMHASMLGWFESEDRRIWAQFFSALMVAGTKGMSESMVVAHVDGMLRLYKTRFPIPCAK